MPIRRVTASNFVAIVVPCKMFFVIILSLSVVPILPQETATTTTPPVNTHRWMLYAVFPTGGNLFYRQELLRPALDYAVKQINDNRTASETLLISFTGTDGLTTCDDIDSLAVYILVEAVTQQVVSAKFSNFEHVPLAYFGPGCANTVESIAKWLNAKQNQVPQFDGIAASSNLEDRTEFPSLIRTGYTEARFVQFFENVMAHFQWKSTYVVLFVDRSDAVWETIWSPLAKHLSPQDELYYVIPIEAYCSAVNETTDIFEGIFTDMFPDHLRHEFNAIVFFAHTDCVKRILVEAVRQNLTEPAGQVTFIVINFFDAAYWGSLNTTSYDFILPDDTYAADLRKAYSQTFVASYYVNDRMANVLQNFNAELIQFVRADPDKYGPPGSKYELALEEEGINPTVLHYYSAVHVYAQAMRMVFEKEGRSNATEKERRAMYTKGHKIADEIRSVGRFDVPFMDTVRLDSNGDVLGSFAVKYYNTSSESFENWLAFCEDDADLVVRANHHYQAATSPVPVTPSPTQAGPGDDVSTRPTPTDRPIFGEGPTRNGEIIGMAAGVGLIVLISALVIKYYVTKARLGSKWWVIDPTVLKYLKPTDNDKAMAYRTHDTQTMRSENNTYMEFLVHETKGLRLAKYQGQIVAVRLMKRKWTLSRKLLEELHQVKVNGHVNLLRFYGICVDRGEYLTVSEYAFRGSLHDLFLGPQEDVGLDWSLRYSLLLDLIEGMIFVHKSFGYHGNLASLKCMIDRTFVLKIVGYGPRSLQEQLTDLTPWDLLWMAPDILRKSVTDIEKMTVVERQKADIYSIGIIMQELITESVPFPGPDKTHIILQPHEIVEKVRSSSLVPPYRPILPTTAVCDKTFQELMESCWSEDPNARPTLVNLKICLKAIRGPGKGSLFDELMERVQCYADQLHQAVEERTLQLREEQHKIQSLLYELLPKSVADRLISKRAVDPEPFDCVTIYFSDIVSFTTIAAESTAAEVVDMLNQLYQLFDGIIEHFDAYKVETIGDAYMVVSGLPHRNGSKHAPYISALSLYILQAAGDFRIPHRPHDKFKIRIGVHSGACVAGVVGNKMPRYCLFGDTVNTASRMESTSEPNKVQLSRATAELIRDDPDFRLESRGAIDIKGKGPMETYWLTPGRTLPACPSPVINEFSYMRRATLRNRASQSQVTLHASEASSIVRFRT